MVLALGVLSACNNSSQENSNKRSVILAKPERLGSSYEVKRTGIIKEAHTINLGFKTAGQIKRILAQEGDHVKKESYLRSLTQKITVLELRRYKYSTTNLKTKSDEPRSF